MPGLAPIGSTPIAALDATFALAVECAGALTPSGGVSTRKGTVNTVAFTASLALAGSVARRTARALSGGLSFSGTAARFYLKAARFFAGTLTANGILSKHTAKGLSGALGLGGALLRRKLRRALKLIEAAGFIFGK